MSFRIETESIFLEEKGIDPREGPDGAFLPGFLWPIILLCLVLSLYLVYFRVLPSAGACLVAQAVKNLPAMQETWARSLSGEDPLEKNMATHSSILAWRIPWTEEPGGLQSMGPQRVRHD
ncbi:unnamed protein product [Rangifer tarandus platyrhynchus]|uniref:Uncharacterized protein n=2 Tax=Rangifer tarandus platyrhynchus TaxID=3082113 RepID=A0ABN8YJB2_RANTA|nr:unnamed protein product [Rangifer tarandus platyrhynchus]